MFNLFGLDKKVTDSFNGKTKDERWICDFCGESNASYESECQDCGHERED
ncbi:MAG: hypothetical protein ACRDCW_02755 [Sarcina sp.]